MKASINEGMHMKKVLIVVILLAVVGIGAWLIIGKDNNSSDTTSTTNSQKAENNETKSNTPSEPSVASDNTPVAATITFTNNGFESGTITVKSGDTVEIKNDSNQPLQMDSDPHPAHTDDPELNVGVVSPGESQKFTLTTKGTWGYHNHLNPNDRGRVNVE